MCNKNKDRHCTCYILLYTTLAIAWYCRYSFLHRITTRGCPFFFPVSSLSLYVDAFNDECIQPKNKKKKTKTVDGKSSVLPEICLYSLEYWLFFFCFCLFFFKGSYTLNEFEWQIPFYSDVPFCSEKLCVSYLQVSLSRLERAKVHGLLPHTWHQLSIFCWIDNKSFFFFSLFITYAICV